MSEIKEVIDKYWKAIAETEKMQDQAKEVMDEFQYWIETYKVEIARSKKYQKVLITVSWINVASAFVFIILAIIQSNK